MLLPPETVPEHLFKTKILECYTGADIQYIDGEYRVIIDNKESPLEMHNTWKRLVAELNNDGINTYVTMIMKHPVKLCYELDAPKQSDLLVLGVITEEEFMENMNNFEPTEDDCQLIKTYASMGIQLPDPILSYTGLTAEELEELDSGNVSLNHIKNRKMVWDRG